MTAPHLVAVTTPDAAGRWADAGFATVGGSVWLGPVEVRCGVDGPSALVFSRPHPLGLDDLDGIRWLVDDAAPPPQASHHPNGVDGFDHLVVMAPDLDRVRGALVGAGFEIRRERAASIAGSEVTQLFAFAGDALLELVAPAGAPSGAGASTVWGVAVISADLDATVATLGDRIGTPRDAVQRGRRIASLRTPEIGLSLTVAVMSPRP